MKIDAIERRSRKCDLPPMGFTPVEKAADFNPVRKFSLSNGVNRRSANFQADGGLMPPSALTVRECDSSLTGFTLLEVLIAVVLFTIGTIALITALNSGIFSVSDVEKTRLALNVAQANMELIKSKSFTDIDTNVEISNLVSNLGFSDFTVSGNVAEGQNPMQADVIAAWNVKGGQTSVTLTTLIANY